MLAAPNTAPKYPWYRPRSRGDTTSAMIAWASTISPPPPSPCIARKAISWPMSCGQTAQDAADQEHDDGDLEQPLAAEEVAELAVERRRHRGRQQIGGDHPRQMVEAAELAGDRRQGGGDDRLIQRGEEHARASGR